MQQRLLFASLALASGLAAQDCPRVQTQLSSGTVTTSFAGFTGWRTCAPAQSLPANPGLGLAATARVVYACFPDRSAGVDVVLVRRSTDGGWSFGAPVAAWTAQAGEAPFDGANLRIACDGHSVFVLVEATRNSDGSVAPATEFHQWVAGSNDQGQTWQTVDVSAGIDAALPSGDLLSFVANPGALAAANGRCHVAFAARYASAVGLGGAASTVEDIYYQAVEFDGTGTLVRAFANERQLEGTPTGRFDSDDPVIAAEGNLVGIAWQDISGGGSNTTGNDTYTVVSTDGGATLPARVNHTNFAGAGSGIDFSTRIGIDANLIVVTYADARSGVDRTYVSIDQTGTGAAFTTNVEACKSPAGVDNDNVSLAVEAGRIYVGYEDDRASLDDIFVVVDRNGGNDILGGTQIEHLVSAGGATEGIEIYGSDAAGDVYAIAYEPDATGAGEGAGFSYTTDGGLSFHRCDAQRAADSEVDDPDVSVTLNRDITLVYQTEPNGTSPGNSANNVFFAGAKVPMLRDDTGIGGGIRYTKASPGDFGHLVLLLPSFTAPTSNGTIVPSPIPALDGVLYNFTLDGLSAAAVGNIGLFIGNVDASGEVIFTLPNLATILGAPVHWFALSVDGLGTFGRAFTDPIRQV